MPVTATTAAVPDISEELMLDGRSERNLLATIPCPLCGLTAWTPAAKNNAILDSRLLSGAQPAVSTCWSLLLSKIRLESMNVVSAVTIPFGRLDMQTLDFQKFCHGPSPQVLLTVDRRVISLYEIITLNACGLCTAQWAFPSPPSVINSGQTIVYQCPARRDAVRRVGPSTAAETCSNKLNNKLI